MKADLRDDRPTPGLARGMWTLIEPFHGVTYFTAEGRAGFETAGLRGFWRGYFAGRAAPLGAVGAAPVTALFYTFSPTMTTRALPSVWGLIDPATALVARSAGAAAALRRLTAGLATDPTTDPTSDPTSDAPGDPIGVVAGLVDRLWPVVAGLDSSGRALGAANAALPRPEDPYAALWQAATTLREHRGDGHLAALVTADLTGAEAVVLRSSGELDRALMQVARGWSDQEWDAVTERLLDRGLLTRSPEPVMTDAGWQLITEVEATTDRIAARAWSEQVSADQLRDLAASLLPFSRACLAGLPQPNPIGMQTVWDVVAVPSGVIWSGGGPQVS